MSHPRTDDQLRYTRIVGRNVRWLRTEQRLSGQQLADATSATSHPLYRSAISEIETGTARRAVTVDQLMALAAALGSTPALLLADFDTDTPEPS
jgi:transcriptional regulator with XRE-family HTH domain